MTFKEIFHFNNFFYKIKLDHSEKVTSIELKEETKNKDRRDDEKFYCSEWNQEYELIYLSYVLEE